MIKQISKVTTKNVIRTVAAGALLLLGSNAFAQNRTEFGTVTEISVGTSGNIIVAIDAPQLNPASCTFSGYQIGDIAQRTEWYAQLLTAQASGSTVRLTLSPTQCNNGGGNPRITAIAIR